MSADLTPSQIQEAVASTIEEDPLFVDTPVVRQNGKKQNEIEDALSSQGKGSVVIVGPPHTGTNRDQKSNAVIIDTAFLVVVEINPQRNYLEDGANLDPVAAWERIIKLVTKRDRHAGGEFFKFQGLELLAFSEGSVLYELEFTKENTL